MHNKRRARLSKAQTTWKALRGAAEHREHNNAVPVVRTRIQTHTYLQPICDGDSVTLESGTSVRHLGHDCVRHNVDHQWRRVLEALDDRSDWRNLALVDERRANAERAAQGLFGLQTTHSKHRRSARMTVVAGQQAATVKTHVIHRRRTPVVQRAVKPQQRATNLRRLRRRRDDLPAYTAVSGPSLP